MIDRKELVEKLNSLCWAARSYGHDDNGLDYGLDIDGNEVEDDRDVDVFHPEAIYLADELLELLS